MACGFGAGFPKFGLGLWAQLAMHHSLTNAGPADREEGVLVMQSWAPGVLAGPPLSGCGTVSKSLACGLASLPGKPGERASLRHHGRTERGNTRSSVPGPWEGRLC